MTSIETEGGRAAGIESTGQVLAEIFLQRIEGLSSGEEQGEPELAGPLIRR
jgi:hypothetical protein